MQVQAEDGRERDLNVMHVLHGQHARSPAKPQRLNATLPDYEPWLDSVLRKAQLGGHGIAVPAPALDAMGPF